MVVEVGVVEVWCELLCVIYWVVCVCEVVVLIKGENVVCVVEVLVVYLLMSIVMVEEVIGISCDIVEWFLVWM